MAGRGRPTSRRQKFASRRGASVIESLSLDVERRAPVGVLELTEAIAAEADGRVVRWSISRVEEERLSVEVSRLAGADAEPADLRPSGHASPLGQTAVVNVVPTGIGCAIGGVAARRGR